MARKLMYNEEEGGMAKAQLQKIEMYAAKLNDMIHPEDELEGWVQNKLSVVAAYMGDVKHYLDYALQNEPEYKEFADGGMTDKPRYWEVEFTWSAADEESRKVNLMAESVSDAEEQVRKKFGPYYEGLKVVEVEEDKEMSWEEYAKRPKKFEIESTTDYDVIEAEDEEEAKKEWMRRRKGDSYKSELLKVRRKFADGGMTEKYFIYKDQEKYLNQLKEGEIDSDDLETLLNNLFTDVHKVNRVNQSDFKEITKSEKDLIVKTAIGWGIAEMVDGKVEFVERDDDDEYADGGVLDDLKNQGVKKEFIRQAFFAGGNNGSKAAMGKDFESYEQWLKKHKIKHHIIYQKAFEDGGKAAFNNIKGRDFETFEEWQKKIEKEWSGKMASGGMMDWLDKRYELKNKIKELEESIKSDYDDDEVSRYTREMEEELLEKKEELKEHLQKIKMSDGGQIDKSGGTMRYEGSTEAEDFKEAEEYIGKDVWETLSNEDKLNATQYLKAKGVIGYAGQEEDLADFMASQYAKGGSLYRGYRPSPSISATAYPRGFKMIGNDGNMWEISLDSRGVHRWTKSTSASRNDRMEQKAKIREAIELLESMRDEIDVDDEIATLKKLQ